MAGFDPQVQPEQPGNYIFWSRPIQQPQPNRAGETLGRAVGGSLSETGRLVSEGSNVANQVQQRGISEQLAQQYDPVRDQYIQRLSQIDDVMAGRKPEESLASPTGQKMPGDLAALPSKVDDLIAIRDNGRVSPTYFDMLKDQMAKDARRRNPNQRDFIDAEFSRITERDPANKVIQSLTADINAYAAAAKEQRNKNEQRIYNSGIPGLYEAVYLKHSIPEDKAIGLAAQRQSQKATAELEDLQMRNQAMKRTLTEQDATDHNTDALSKDLALNFQEWSVHVPQMADENIQTFMNEWQDGKHPMSDEQAVQLRQAIDSRKAAWMANARYLLFKTDQTGKSRADYMGGAAKANELIVNLAKQFDTIGELFSKDAIPQAIAHKTMLEAAASDTGYNLIKSVPWAAQTQAVNHVFGSQSAAAADWVQKAFVNENVNKDLKAWALSTNMGLTTQTPGYAAQGGVFSLGEALQSGADKGVKGPSGAKVNQHVINTMGSTLANQDNPPEVLTNAGKAVFGPEDQNLMNLFKSSEIDRNGRLTPGKSTVFSNLVNDKVSKSIRRLGNPEVTRNYIDTATKWMGNIFQSEIETLNRSTPVQTNDPTIAGAVARSSTTKPYHFVWDSTNLAWHVVVDGVDVPTGTAHDRYVIARRESLQDKNPPVPSYDTLNELSTVRDAVTKLNAGIQSISSVYRTFAKKDDVNGLILQFFMAAGLNPSQNTDTPAGQLLEAVKNSQQPKEEGSLDGNRDE